MSIFKQRDLTKGKPWKVILLFAIPILLSSILSNAFSLINALVLKTTVGGNSVTAISSTGSISSILFQFAYGCSGGFAILVCNHFGNKDYKNVRKTFYNGVYLSVIIGILITTIGLLIYKDLLVFLNVDAIYLEKAQQYYFIILLSFVFMLLTNYLGNFLRATGDSTAPLIITVISTIVNIVFAFVFTGIIKLDTRGVAIATLLANLSNVIISYIYILRKYDYLKIKDGFEKVDFNNCLILLKLGIPLGLKWSILFIGSFFQSKTINGFGPAATKAAGCFSSFESYLFMPFSAISSSFLNYTGQNYGTKNINRIKKGLVWAILIDAIAYVVILVAGLLIAPYVPYIFLPANEVNEVVNGQLIIHYCSTYLKIVIPFVFLQGILTVCRSTLQGIQKPLIPFISGIGELFVRLAICLLLPGLINPANPISDESFKSICFSSPGAWMISTLIMGGSVLYFILKNDFVEKNNSIENGEM